VTVHLHIGLPGDSALISHLCDPLSIPDVVRGQIMSSPSRPRAFSKNYAHDIKSDIHISCYITCFILTL